jgi:hypothetical protein
MVPLGNGTRSTPPSSEEPQGLSPVDYELEVETNFPSKMVVEMQENNYYTLILYNLYFTVCDVVEQINYTFFFGFAGWFSSV